MLQPGQQFLRVAVVVRDGVWVLAVEVVVAGLDLVESDLPGDLGLLAPRALGSAPPVDAALQVLDPDRPGLEYAFCPAGTGCS